MGCHFSVLKGMPLEFLDLSGPARDECFEGLLTVAPLKVTGATGSPINPIFIA